MELNEYNNNNNNNNHLTAVCPGQPRVGRYQKKHSPAHTHPGQRTSFITFLHLQRSTASSFFNLRLYYSLLELNEYSSTKTLLEYFLESSTHEYSSTCGRPSIHSLSNHSLANRNSCLTFKTIERQTRWGPCARENKHKKSRQNLRQFCFVVLIIVLCHRFRLIENIRRN